MLLLKPASVLGIEKKDNSAVEVLKISGDTVFLQSNFSETDSVRQHKNSAKENKHKKIQDACRTTQLGSCNY